MIRVNVFIGDIVEYLRKKETTLKNEVEQYHAIILIQIMVKGWLSRPQNESLYSLQGTQLLKKLLLPGGCLSVWSSSTILLSVLLKSLLTMSGKRNLEKTGQNSYYYLAVKKAL